MRSIEFNAGTLATAKLMLHNKQVMLFLEHLNQG
jgi:hypothetical protein